MFSDELRFWQQHLGCGVWRRHGERSRDYSTDEVSSLGGGSISLTGKKKKKGLSSLEARLRINPAASSNPNLSPQSGTKHCSPPSMIKSIKQMLVSYKCASLKGK